MCMCVYVCVCRYGMPNGIQKLNYLLLTWKKNKLLLPWNFVCTVTRKINYYYLGILCVQLQKKNKLLLPWNCPQPRIAGSEWGVLPIAATARSVAAPFAASRLPSSPAVAHALAYLCQTDRQIDRQRDRQIERQIDR